MANKIHLLTIDPQWDFCQPPDIRLADILKNANGGVETTESLSVRNGGALCVAGAYEDTIRLAAMVDRLRNKIDDIHVTLDSHHEVDCAHGIFWINSRGEHPAPFTTIKLADVLKGTWTTTSPAHRQRMIQYLTALETPTKNNPNGRYPLMIWPPHCIIGSKGHQIMPVLSDAFRRWSKERFKTVDFVTKGSNPFTEHYSAVKAEVPDPSDPTTMLNVDLIHTLQDADIIPISGQALSHCVANTARDIADEFGDENVRKFVLLTDTCSNVTGCEALGSGFVNDMVARGMQRSTSVEFLA